MSVSNDDCLPQVGDWNNGTLEFTGIMQHGPLTGVRSACSEPCGPGEYKVTYRSQQ